MKRSIGRTFLLTCVVAAVSAAVFVSVASANYFGAVEITCTSATYDYSTFPDGTQTVHETVWMDGVLLAEKVVDFTGSTGTDTINFTVPNDGVSHFLEVNSYSITNMTPIFGLPGTATLTCGGPPPPPPPPAGVCTYTKGYYRNHASVTSSGIAGMGGTIRLGSKNLTAAQAQDILNATPGQPGNVSWGTDNLLLNLAQQLLTSELNVARGSTASSAALSAITQANAAITVTTGGSLIHVSTSLSKPSESTLVSSIEGFNSANDCH